ncbi:MAG: ribosome silencing factor [Candidatus Zipacnadales bacterium]
MAIDSLGIARIAAVAALDGLAEDALILGMQRVATFCDYFVICQGRSILHVGAIQERVLEKLHEQGVRPDHIEGGRNSPWVVLDYGDVVVHIFDGPTRRFYDLESLWADADPVAVKENGSR